MFRIIAALILLATVAGPLTQARAEDPGVSLDLERMLSADPAAMKAATLQANEEQRRIVKALTHESDEAKRKSADGAGEPCVEASLKASKALLQVSEAAEAAMNAALAAGNKEQADFQFRKIAIALRESRRMGQEGSTCALGVGAQDGNTRLNVTGGVGDAIADTRALSSDVFDYGFDPADVSPF
jgi:hypothetical protein